MDADESRCFVAIKKGFGKNHFLSGAACVGSQLGLTLELLEFADSGKSRHQARCHQKESQSSLRPIVILYRAIRCENLFEY